MEEVDNIIIATLKDIGCDYDESIASLVQFSADMIVEACVRCLRATISDFQSPTRLPEAMSSRYRMCSNLANACETLGYQGEIGYQTFLYSSVKEWRKLLMFLLEKMPKDITEAINEPTGAGVLLGRAIAASVSRCLQSPWTPPHLKPKSTAWKGSDWWLEGSEGTHTFHATDVQAPQGTGNLTARIPKDVRRYYSRHMSYVSVQPRIREDVLACLLEKNASEFAIQQEWEAEWNQYGLASRLTEEEYRARKKQRLQKKIADQLRTGGQQSTAAAALGTSSDLLTILNSFADKSTAAQGKGSRFQHAEKLQFSKDDEGQPQVEEASEEELQQRREEELSALQEQLEELTNRLEGLQLNVKRYSTGIQQMLEQRTQQEAKNKEDEEAYRVKKRTYDLLPNADENITKLQELIQSSADRLAKLSAKWEEVRAPLIQKCRELKEASESRESETTRLLEEMKLMRERMKEVADETRTKDELHKQLISEYERMSKDLNRVAYTRRIMEIVANIQKQRDDIDKILVDTRMVQKEINQLTGKLDRVFTITDEQVYRDARKDEARRTAYKLLAGLRENCELVVAAIMETGQVKREQRDLEEQIETESAKKVGANLEKIMADYEQMRKENQQLGAQLKAAAH